ncbi:MAG: hypothetical protein L6V93_04915 [Clostridiales bacterium]|nr:MAG: hypothetical protein L6V93_04915 [Clostridiales bacterium]
MILSFPIFLRRRTRQKQKVELMISAGGADLPDVIINVPLSDSAIPRYASKGFIVPLNNYYKKIPPIT